MSQSQSHDDTDHPDTADYARSIYVQVDSVVSNPVLSAGPEQHETKEEPLSKLEQFFVDVHNVFLEESTAKEKTTSEDESNLKLPQNPLVQADQFIHMAKYQMDNVVQLIDTVLNRSGLTINRLAPTTRQPPSQNALLMRLRTKRVHLKSSSEILLKGAASIRASCEISRASVEDLKKISRFFHVIQGPNRGMAVNISLQPAKPSLVPLVQLDNGHFIIQGCSESDVITELKKKFHAVIYRCVYDSISALSHIKSLRMHRLADRIIWKEADSSIEIFSDLDVSGTELSSAISARLLSCYLADLRKRNIGECSPSSSTYIHEEMQFIEHERLCRSLSYFFLKLTSTYRHVLMIRELHSDSLLHSGWSVYLRNSFIAEVVVERTDIVIRCLSPYPYSAYESRCCNISHVELVLVNAIQRRI